MSQISAANLSLLFVQIVKMGCLREFPSSVEEAQRQKVPACRSVCPGEIDPCDDADAVVHMLIEPCIMLCYLSVSGLHQDRMPLKQQQIHVKYN